MMNLIGASESRPKLLCRKIGVSIIASPYVTLRNLPYQGLLIFLPVCSLYGYETTKRSRIRCTGVSLVALHPCMAPVVMSCTAPVHVILAWFVRIR